MKKKMFDKRKCESEDFMSHESLPKNRIYWENASSNDRAGNWLDFPKAGSSAESPTQPLSIGAYFAIFFKMKALKREFF
jgi:hypothetical protein